MMYVLGEDNILITKIVDLLNESNSETDAFHIADVSLIRARYSILYAPKTTPCEDIVRRLAKIAHQDVRLIFVKNAWKAEHIDTINSIINDVNNSRNELWNDEIKKLTLMSECAARNERIKQLKQWIKQPTSQQTHSFLSFNESTFKSSILSFLHRSNGFRFVEPPISSLTNKPPALHWSNFPRDDELQITFKFVFPFSYIVDEELEELAKQAIAIRQWPYTYEWRYGVLLKHDAVRIGIAQHGTNILEVSGRIDGADLEDDLDENAMRYVWPYLSTIFDIVIKYFEKLSMPFQLYILPIGGLFYESKDIKGRSFDLTQFLISINVRHQVQFQYDAHICSLNVQSVLVDIHPETLSDLMCVRPKEEEEPTIKDDVNSLLQQVPSTNFLTTERISQHRGRRVSFGAIRCIPQQQQQQQQHQQQQQQQQKQQSVDSGDTHIENISDTVGVFVDQFLDETMEQVLIM